MRLQLLGLSLIALVLGACSGSSLISAPNSTASSNAEPIPTPYEGVTSETLQETRAKYETISEKMTLTQVEEILGKADEVSQISIPNQPQIEVYVWHNPNGSTIKTQFQDKVLINKSQLGLISSLALGS